MGHEFAADVRRVALMAAFVALTMTLGWLTPGTPVRAASVVSNCHDSGPGSLRDAITKAASGDTITFSVDCPSGSGTQITLISGGLTIRKSLTIAAIGHTIAVSGNDQVPVFTIDDGLVVSLSMLTIEHGIGTNGGGIESGTSQNGSFRNLLHVSDCVFDSNHATASGGGIYNNSGGLTVSGSTFTNNHAIEGGGITNAGSLTVSNSTFSGNRAQGAGTNSFSYTSVSVSTFSGNLGDGIVFGGTRADLKVTASTFINNKGPGISIFRSGPTGGGTAVTVTNSTFSGNDTSGNNDGIANNDSSLGYMSVINSTVHPNHISSGHGYQLINTIADKANGIHSGGHNLIGPTPDPRLGTLGMYGAKIQTYPLLPGSPAIDAGDQTTCDSIKNDQRGTLRTLNGRCDIGAFEADYSLTLTGGTNQLTSPGNFFSHPLAVTLSTPDTGGPLDGGPITFTAPTSGASAGINPNPTTTGSNGHAQAIAMANAITGTYAVTASMPGVASVTFTLTNAIIDLVVNANTDGAATIANCAIGNAGTCRLRDAIAAVNVGAGNPSPTIAFAGNVFPPNGSQKIPLQATQGALTLAHNVTIDGPGVTALILDGGNSVTVLAVDPNVTATIHDLTIQHGNGGPRSAGGIANSGALSVTGVSLIGNVGSGGAILNTGTLGLSRSTLNGNSVGITNSAAVPGQQASASVANSTIANNTGSGFTNTASASGAQAMLTLTNITVAGNGAGGVMSMASNGLASVTAVNTIVSGNTGGDVSGTFTGGANVIGGNARLGPLANNGGETQTMALLPGSPAIAHGAPSFCAAAPVSGVDERGVTRPSGACAIGAYEPPTVTAIAPSSGGTGGGGTVTLSGTGFLAGATVMLGSAACTNVQVISATKLTCTAPAHTAGAVDVVVTSGGGAATLAGGYTYGIVNPLPQTESGSQGSQTGNNPNPLPQPEPAGQGVQHGGLPAPLPPRRP